MPKRKPAPRRQPMSRGETEVARFLWDIGPATVRQVHEIAIESSPVDFATVQTYLRRLESKGYASSVLEGRIRVYTATAKPRSVIRTTVNDFVGQLFGGHPMPLVRHLLEDGNLNQEEIAELRELVDQLDSKPAAKSNGTSSK